MQFVISQDFDQFENEIRKLAGGGAGGQGGGRKPNSQGERKLVDSRIRFLSCGIVKTLPDDTIFSDWLVLEFRTQQLGFSESRILFIALSIQPMLSDDQFSN